MIKGRREKKEEIGTKPLKLQSKLEDYNGLCRYL